MFRPCETQAELLTAARAQRAGRRKVNALPEGVMQDLSGFTDTLQGDLTGGVRMTGPAILGAWAGLALGRERFGGYGPILGAAVGAAAGGHARERFHPNAPEPGSISAHAVGMFLPLLPAIVAWRRGTVADSGSLMGTLGLGLGGLLAWAFAPQGG